ncbi:hypothetical protein BV898_08507 [Hypsibius exemplaris]|uniref:G-protein coupled receptors family 1 profile domain-containing protein n=1 Tax=Hypsibius exemplaris TaxID=2072580 RepID=A0A1W0WQD0_HYPEX|nr:hypothetical protein BV898_08507 [Hypsibius exemplaris]
MPNLTNSNGSSGSAINSSTSVSAFELPSRTYVNGWLALSTVCTLMGSGCLLLLMATSFRRTRLHSGANVLVINLMVMELFICGISTPIQLITTYAGLTRGHIHIDCHLWMYCQISLVWAENWAATVLAVNRLFALALPHQYKALTSKPGLVTMVILPWLIGLGGNLPTFFGIGGNFILRLTPFETCTLGINPSGTSAGYGVAWVTLGTFLPMALIGGIYIFLGGGWIVRHVLLNRKKNHVFPGQNGQAKPTGTPNKARQIALAKMLVGSYIWHCLCFLPPPILISSFPWLAMRHPLLVQLWLNKTVNICGYMISPFIFLALSTDYQTGLKDLIRIRPHRTDHASRRVPTVTSSVL